MRHFLIYAAVLAPLWAASVSAQQPRPSGGVGKGDSLKELPLKPARKLSFRTEEGTWISLDVSPDGRTIVFDLLGDLYTMPIAGGMARRITEGMPFDGQPRYSPDGKSIAFVSDRSGAENLWIIDADGRNLRAVTQGDKSSFASPEWTPDGEYIVASKDRSWPTFSGYDLYLYHQHGGAGVKLTLTAVTGPPFPGRRPSPDNFMGAAFGKDPRYIYVAVKLGRFGYNLQLPTWQVAVYDLETGKTFFRTDAPGSGMRPVLSPDGKYLVYATRLESATALRLRDLASGDEAWLAKEVQHDDQESRYTRDLMPGASFTPDGKALITSYGGKIWRVEVPSGKATQIPFTVDVDLDLGPRVSFEYPLNDSILTVQQIRGARPSPDGKLLVFTALDKVWVMDLPDGKRRRLTTMRSGEHSPVWSPDGRWIAFVTWSDQGGHVYRARADGTGKPQRLTQQSAFYEKLNYSPEGKKLIVARGPRQHRVEAEEPDFSPASGIELVWLPAEGGETTTITPLSYYGYPHFTRDNSSRIYIYEPEDGLVSMRLDGTDRKSLLKVTGFTFTPAGGQPFPEPADEVLISPAGDRMLAQVNSNLWLITAPVLGGQTLTVSITNPAAAPVPVKRVTRIGGDFIGWVDHGRSFYYSSGHSYFTYNLPLADSLVRDSTAKADSLKKAQGDAAEKLDSARVVDTTKKAKPAYEPTRVDVVITVPRDRPSGTVVLRGGRIITMKGNDVIENGDVVVRNNRILAVGPSGSIPLPRDVKTIDVAGKTIIPGWVDIHAHMWTSWGIHRSQVWQYLANLAYGVTTTRDPQTGTTDVLSYGDLVETGEILGPRIFSTGPGVFWSDEISSLDDARDVLRRYSDYYNTHTIKQYMTGDRKVRQSVIMASKELGLMPTSEGGLDFKKNLTEAIDGYPGHEHSYPIFPLYRDVVELLSKSGITATPTLLVNYGGPFAENYFYERYDIHKDEKLRRFTPHVEVDRRALRRPGWFREDQYVFPKIAQQAGKIVAAGGRVGLGGHGQLQGLGVHWELWAVASGGMPPHDVLRVGTLFGAEAIGLGRELGSIEPGKFADLQVLDANPLTDIKNTNTVRYVMKNGRLYEAETLREIWPRQREMERPWWKEPDAL